MNTTIDRPPSSSPKSRKPWILVAVIALVIVVALAAGGVWWFLRDDSPAAVSLDTATESVETTDGSANTTVDGIAGTWTVDTDTGTFNYDDSTGTFVGFRIDEELQGIGSTTAVGRTPDVTGEITIEGTTLTEGTIEADMTTITTNDGRRDDRVQSALDTGEFPTATFVLTTPVDLGASAESGAAVKVDAVGDLTIHGVTKQVTIPLEAQLVNGTIVVVGSIDITFDDYDVSVPSAPIVVSAEDNGILEIQVLFTQG